MAQGESGNCERALARAPHMGVSVASRFSEAYPEPMRSMMDVDGVIHGSLVLMVFACKDKTFRRNCQTIPTFFFEMGQKKGRNGRFLPEMTVRRLCYRMRTVPV